MRVIFVLTQWSCAGGAGLNFSHCMYTFYCCEFVCALIFESTNKLKLYKVLDNDTKNMQQN